MDITAAKRAMADLYAAIAAPAEPGSGAAGSLDADTLLDTIEQTQQVINIAGGIQTHAIAHLAAHDEVSDDDTESGWVWKRHGLGFTAEDTASLLAPRLGVSVPVAQGRVEVAVHQVTITPRLVDAMGCGDLDLFRASIITREVMPCRDEIARAIVDRLLDHYSGPGAWSETAGPLGSRTRRLVARLAPDVAAAAKERAIKDRTLNRRAVSAAADQWYGLVPVEQSLVMWQAVDDLAHQLRAADPDLTLDQARLDALQQLVLGQADVTIHLHATHTHPEPGDTGAPGDESPEAEAPDANPSDPVAPAKGSRDGQRLLQPPVGLAERAVRGLGRATGVPVTGVVELGGLNRPGTTTVNLDRLPSCVRLVQSTPLGCHRDTGALLAGHVPKALAPCDLISSVTDQLEEQYRPSAALRRLILLRDGHCRFPGCQVPARSCDLDHVIAWPTGPTAPLNLMALCRRHHRVKQRPGWTARLDLDGVVHWTDPGGRTTPTDPVSHLDRLPHPVTSEPARTGRARIDPDPTPCPRLTRAALRALVHSDPASPESLAELSLARHLDLARTTTRPPSPTWVDWHHRPVGKLVGTTWASSDDPPGHDEPPPF